MGRFVKGENVYVLGKIVEVDPEDSTHYRIQTNKARFYVTEAKDTIRSNPAEVYTAPELYAMLIDVAKMSQEDIVICFGEDITSVEELLLAGWSITDIREKFVEWQYGNNVVVGDMVYYTPTGSPEEFEPILCSVIGIVEGDVPDTATDNVYSIFNDQSNVIYQAVRSEITNAHKRSSKINQSLVDLKDATKEAREAIG